MAVALLTHALALVAIAVAYRRGGVPEQQGAAVLAAMLCLSFGGYRVWPLVYHRVDPISLLVDLIGLVGFTTIGFKAKRFWPLWAGSLQLLSTGAHLLRALDVPVRPPVYYWMKSGPTWAVMLLLILGTWLHMRRVSRARANSSAI